MPPCLRSSSLPLPGLCPPCHPRKLPPLRARPHPSVMRENTQTSSKGCCTRERVLQPGPTAQGRGHYSSWGRCHGVAEVAPAVSWCCVASAPRLPWVAPALSRGSLSIEDIPGGPVYLLLPTLSCSPGGMEEQRSLFSLTMPQGLTDSWCWAVVSYLRGTG